ncbi:MAG: VWA domain-containing protein [Deltaproteobacteria bacterium]|nr:VWA domain-containing protein [Deltaproteobacteria bacterium]
MQKTALIFGLALSTLVGALLLAPRMKAPDPPKPTPRPTPIAASPVTELVYADDTLAVTARLDRGYVDTRADEPLWMDVAIKATGVQTHAPLTAILVVDRSGSMAGDKIDGARMAAERFVNGLREGDQLGVITFGTDVTTELPLTAIDGSSRARALRVVQNIEEGGGTNIDGGMAAARRMLESAELTGRVARVVLVSDGRPTEGDRREATLAGHAASLREHGITTSTLGLGLDYNEDLMERMAVDGGGRYHYLRHVNQLAQILDNELQQGAAVIASSTRLFFPSGGVVEVLDAPGARINRGGSQVSIDVGDLAAGEERHVLVKLHAGAIADIAAFGAPELTYKKAGQSAQALLAHRADPFRVFATTDLAQLDDSRRDDVRVRVLQVEASLALTESMQDYAKGDATTARRKLAEKKEQLGAFAVKTKNVALAAEVANFDQVMQAVAAAPAPASEAAQDMIKEQKARAFTLRR